MKKHLYKWNGISHKTQILISLSVFTIFYFSNFFTGDNLIYPEYAKRPILNCILSLLTIMVFLFLTYVFSYSKKFVVIVSIYFLAVLSLVVCAIVFDGIALKLATIPFYLILFSYAIPTEHFTRGIYEVLEGFNIKTYATNDYMFFITFAVIVILFYTVYLIGRRKGKRI